MIEIISAKALLANGPRYGLTETWWDMRTHWRRPDIVALKALCEIGAPMIATADALGRPPETLIDQCDRTGLSIPHGWDCFRRVRKRVMKPPKEPSLQYPYIRHVRGEHADLLAVNAIVPRYLPDHVRADVCQEIMLAIWQKEMTLDELREDTALVRKFTKGFYKANLEAGGHAISLDVPMRDGRSWYDVLPDPASMLGAIEVNLE
jgi:hypothetical protein